MKRLEVKEMEFNNPAPTMEEISAMLDQHGAKQKIEVINWNEFPYKPEVSFSIGYTGTEILLKYYVTEQYFKAEKTETNQMVCEDSCVEFFISPAEDGLYYNLEFNGIGTCLFGYGTGRADLKRADPVIVDRIRRLTSVGARPVTEIKGPFTWTETISVPAEVFFKHDVKSLKGKSFRANFYKCGDMLTVPHFVTWNPVKTEKPDYHRPEYFGLIKFV